MGNCLTCFKEPASTALDSTTPNCHKEEMTEAARLYPAPSHVPASCAPTDATQLSNGNHLGGGLGSVLGSTGVPPVLSDIAASAPAITKFYPTVGRRVQSKSAPAMGTTDSKPSDSRLNALFETYKDECEDTILAEGIEQLCKDLQVSPDDFKVLVLAWKLNAEQMCRFTRVEFVNGLRSMRADSIKSIQTRLPEVVADVEQNDEQFKDLYRFTFRFGLDTAAGQRILPTDMATVLWRLVFTVREPPILGRWLRFLDTHQSIRGIPRDTWNMFLNFAEAVGDDLSCYDDNEAWPSLFDDFVEYENDQANQNISKEKECDDRLIQQDN
ncbi:DCN1-like protein 3 [Aethina tumida]|uniref:DCN1-like protein 3 n=1 Tax=Aethina tumida TaxID=116153 RepID=UPI0021497223|nr:DCN1-like protein 3 [Aethina tumida]XP_049817829.1 DCN1-like protein 3 [Aethina tumida]